MTSKTSPAVGKTQAYCKVCGFRSSPALFFQRPSSRGGGLACPKCRGPAKKVQMAGVTPTPVSFMGAATPADARTAKDDLAPYIQQLKVLATQNAAKLSAPLLAGWNQWAAQWDAFYAATSSIASASDDLAKVAQLKKEYIAWKAKISSVSGGAKWTAPSMAAVAGVAVVGGLLTYYAKTRGGYTYLPVGAVALGATGGAYYLASPSDDVLTPPDPVKPPGILDRITQWSSNVSAVTIAATVVGGGVVLYMVKTLGPAALDKVKVIPV